MLGRAVKVAARRHWQSRSSPNELLKAGGILREMLPLNCLVTLAPCGHSAEGLRHFSSNIYDSDFLCSNKTRLFQRDLKVNTKDFLRTDGPLTSLTLDNSIKEAVKNAGKSFDISVLKDLYYRLVRPELVSRLLVHKHPFSHTYTHWLKYQTHVLIGDKPRFTTSYDVMFHLVGLNKDDWVFFLNYLAKERIVVIEEWISISFTHHMIYDHGLKDFGDIHFHKGEADASWHQQSNTADLSGLIWEDQQVISARTHLDVPDCYSVVQSEAKAALVVTTEAKMLGIENFVLWTDNRVISGAMSGTRHIKDKDRELFLSLRSLRPSFKRLLVVCVPREMLEFTDGMLREEDVKMLKKTGIKYPRFVKKSAKGWAYHLNGLPVFRLAMTPEAHEIMSSFDKPLDGEPRAKGNMFYVMVESDKKISALQNLVSVLNPARLYVAVQYLEHKPEVLLKDLYELVGNRVVINIVSSWSILCNKSTTDNPKGTVKIVFDCWSSDLEMGLPNADLTILLSTAGDTSFLTSMGIPELSASSFVYYHGPCLPTEM